MSSAFGRFFQQSVSAVKYMFPWLIGIGLIAWCLSWLWFGGFIPKWSAQIHDSTHRAIARVGFSVEDVLIEGRFYTSQEDVARLIPIEKGQSIFKVPVGRIQQDIEALSWVKKAHVERRFPHVVYIALLERQPAALWQKDKKVRLIDRDGVVLDHKPSEAFQDYILIVGERAEERFGEFLSLLQAEPDLSERASTAAYIGERRWDLIFKNNIRLQLPEEEAGFALHRVARLHDETGILDKDLMVIDARHPEKISVQFKLGHVQDYLNNQNNRSKNEKEL